MNFFISIYRLFKFTFQNFFRNFWLSFISMTVFVLTLLTINVMLFVNVLTDTALKAVEDKVEVAVWMTPDASEAIAKSAQGYLLGLEQVRDVRYIPAEESLETFKSRYADNAVIINSLSEVGGNPFGPALVVSLRSTDDLDFVLEAVQTPEYAPYIKRTVDDDYRGIIDNIQWFSSRMRVAGAGLALFFAIVAILIIFNAIRVAIYVHRDEIAIMKLVGANDWLIRGPFLLEAIIYSAVATLIMFALITASLSRLEPLISFYFGGVHVGLSDFFLGQAWVIFGGQFLALAIMSLVTTMLAMRRYLRV